MTCTVGEEIGTIYLKCKKKNVNILNGKKKHHTSFYCCIFHIKRLLSQFIAIRQSTFQHTFINRLIIDFIL